MNFFLVLILVVAVIYGLGATVVDAIKRRTLWLDTDYLGIAVLAAGFLLLG